MSDSISLVPVIDFCIQDEKFENNIRVVFLGNNGRGNDRK